MSTPFLKKIKSDAFSASLGPFRAGQCAEKHRICQIFLFSMPFFTRSSLSGWGKASDSSNFLVFDAFSHLIRSFGQGKSIGILIFSCFRCFFSLEQAFRAGEKHRICQFFLFSMPFFTRASLSGWGKASDLSFYLIFDAFSHLIRSFVLRKGIGKLKKKPQQNPFRGFAVAFRLFNFLYLIVRLYLRFSSGLSCYGLSCYSLLQLLTVYFLPLLHFSLHSLRPTSFPSTQSITMVSPSETFPSRISLALMVSTLRCR